MLKRTNALLKRNKNIFKPFNDLVIYVAAYLMNFVQGDCQILLWKSLLQLKCVQSWIIWGEKWQNSYHIIPSCLLIATRWLMSTEKYLVSQMLSFLFNMWHDLMLNISIRETNYAHFFFKCETNKIVTIWLGISLIGSLLWYLPIFIWPWSDVFYHAYHINLPSKWPIEVRTTTLIPRLHALHRLF